GGTPPPPLRDGLGGLDGGEGAGELVGGDQDAHAPHPAARPTRAGRSPATPPRVTRVPTWTPEPRRPSCPTGSWCAPCDPTTSTTPNGSPTWPSRASMRTAPGVRPSAPQHGRPGPHTCSRRTGQGA